LAFILFEFLDGQSGNDPNFRIENSAVQEPVPEPGTLALIAAALAIAAFFGSRLLIAIPGRCGL
jgi:hypothetical protein